MKLKLPASWEKCLGAELKKDYFKKLTEFLNSEIAAGKTIYPKQKNIFNALAACPFEQVKVVIIGQDPYHGEGQAHGLSFSVENDIKLPPSLKNIYKELKSDLDIEPATHGNLTPWAEQGVLLLNSVLTVEAGLAASHRKKGWEEFTDKIIEVLNTEKENLVFILWGNDAKKKGKKIDREKHLVLESGHPSPLSVRFFTDCQHFSKTNHYLEENNLKPIDWKLD
ncbi:MAG: uracil-DNA glycosylase [Halobacteriovoraceae bacterium]|nr:uracil-DNA glycosylase [Halobacteriovoraceae bacterium]|tara:strand:- start:18075 stop:18746 length:672 start_codon:yes stop_codon:yes gene_type:complete